MHLRSTGSASVNGLRVLHASDEGPRARALAEALRNRGHEVRAVRGLGEILEEPGADVLVLDAYAESGVRDLLLLEQSRSAGIELPIVLVTRREGFEICRRALELGAADVVQGAFAPSRFVDAVEDARHDERPAPARAELARPRPELAVRYTAGPNTTRDAQRDLVSFLARREVVAPHVARIVCAAGELVENACRHAFDADDEEGTVRIEAEVRGLHVHLTVTDDGGRLDVASARLDAVSPALPTGPPHRRRRIPTQRNVERGLARVALLAERVRVDGDGEHTRVSLDFELTPVWCGDRDLPAVDDLTPEHVRACVTAVRDGASQDAFPALTLVLRRLCGDVAPSSTERVRG